MNKHDTSTPVAEAAQPAANSAFSELTQAIASAIREGHGPKKVGIAQLKRRSAFNPTGRSRKDRRLTHNWYQNGARLVPTRLFDEEIQLLNEIGSYAPFEVAAVQGLVDVIARDKGTGVVEIKMFYNSKREHAIELARQCRNFRGMLQMVLAAVQEQDAEKPPTRRARRADKA